MLPLPIAEQSSIRTWRLSRLKAGLSWGLAWPVVLQVLMKLSPPFRLIFHDGTAGALLYRVTGEPGEFEMFRHHVMTSPYLMLDRPEVLIVGAGPAGAAAGILLARAGAKVFVVDRTLEALRALDAPSPAGFSSVARSP